MKTWQLCCSKLQDYPAFWISLNTARAFFFFVVTAEFYRPGFRLQPMITAVSSFFQVAPARPYHGKREGACAWTLGLQFFYY